MSLDLHLEVRSLDCGYNGKAVLQNLSFHARSGESIALLGANGSGKSTLLKSLNGDIAPLGGDVTVSSEIQPESSVFQLSHAVLAKWFAVVPQEEPAAFPFTVREVVLMGRLVHSESLLDTREDRLIADEAMEQTECAHLAERHITEISGGEKQRVLIARSLAQQSPIVLLDEPTSHLDPAHQISIAELIRGLAKAGKIVFTAVHDLNLAATFAGRALLLNEGEVVLDAPVETVLASSELDHAYQTRFERIEATSGRLVIIPSQRG